MEGLGFVDGTITPLAEARVPLTDRGYLLGDGVFETMRAMDGQLFRAEDHQVRLQHGLEILGQDPAIAMEAMAAAQELVRTANELGPDLYVRVNVTTGTMEDIAGNDRGVSITGSCKKFQPYPVKHYSEGIHLVVSPHRKDAEDALSTIKHLSYLPYIASRRHAMAQTAHDSILLNLSDDVAEASTSNVFAWVDGVLHAPGPSQGALPGVTRQVVLELAHQEGLAVTEPLTISQLQRADEAFVTNTTGGVVPVTRFDDEPIGDGAVGELTARMGAALEARMRSKP